MADTKIHEPETVSQQLHLQETSVPMGGGHVTKIFGDVGEPSEMDLREVDRLQSLPERPREDTTAEAFQPEASLALPPLNESMNLVLTRKVIPSSVEALKELPAQAPYINPDISELEEALKELAALSKEVKDTASSETVSYFGDYRERTNSVDGAIKRQRKSGARRGRKVGYNSTKTPNISSPSLMDLFRLSSFNASSRCNL
ncbi:hypothetical protein OSTOST_21885 [Ostertagia ostertagi]